MTANVYHHASNQLSCGGPYGFNLFYCCTANVHQGWPKFLLSAVQVQPGKQAKTGAPDGGDGAAGAAGAGAGSTVVVSGYAPSTTRLPDHAGGGTVNVSGAYPFSDTAIVTASTDVQLSLRIPCWSESALITVGAVGAGGSEGVDSDATETVTAMTAPPCAFFNVSAAAGVPINVTFINTIKTYTWKANSTGQY